MGEPNVGKSSILNTILEKKLSIVSLKVQTTRFRLNGILCERESQIACIDTPGICDAKSLRERSYNKVAWQCIYDTNIVALVIDAKKGINNQTELIYKRLKSNSDDSIELVVILNKIDLVDKSKLLSLAAHVSKSYGISEIFFVSWSSFTSDAIPFLKLLIPLATSPIKLDIFPLPNNKTTSITTIAICQIPILIQTYNLFI